MLPSHIIFAYFSRTTFSHATFAHCRLQYTFRRYFCTLFMRALFVCQIHTFLRTIFSQTFVEHYSTTCCCPMPVRTLLSHVEFSHYFPYVIFLASCARYICTPCRTPVSARYSIFANILFTLILEPQPHPLNASGGTGRRPLQ